jgi:hypothetical protein|nr:MAG TPA: hypothetical protein [Caudoviricetes sp.]
MPIIKKFLRGVYEHSNLFKIRNPSVTVGDNEVKEITPFRGVIQTRGSVISSDDFNEMQKNGVYFVETEYSENYGSGVDAYVIKNLESEQELFEGLKLKFVIPKTNNFDNPVVVFKNNNYSLKFNDNENLKSKSLIKDNIVNLIYTRNYFLIELITQASENTLGIAKLYSSTEAETDSDRVKEIIEKNTGNNEESPGKTKWTKLFETLDHTKILTARGLVKFLSKLLKPAGEDDYGLINYKTIKQVSPKPDLSPYIPFSKGYRVDNNADWVIRANKSETWMPHQALMFNENGAYTGAFHINGVGAYYKTPGRNNGNWCQIMDNFDMAARDQRMNNMDTDRTNLWNHANNINGRFNWANTYNSNNYIAPGGSIAAVPANWNEIVIYYKVGSDAMRGTVTFVKGGHAFVHNNGGLHIELRGTVIHSVGANTGTVMQVWVRV